MPVPFAHFQQVIGIVWKCTKKPTLGKTNTHVSIATRSSLFPPNTIGTWEFTLESVLLFVPFAKKRLTKKKIWEFTVQSTIELNIVFLLMSFNDCSGIFLVSFSFVYYISHFCTVSLIIFCLTNFLFHMYSLIL